MAPAPRPCSRRWTTDPPPRGVASRASSGARGDAGQALPLVAGVVALVLVLGLGVARLGTTVGERARAHTAADAAALTAVVEGRAAAEAMARANGGELTRYDEREGDVEVTVRVGDVVAVARARLEWAPPDASSGPP
jgi:hypothetical protein